MRLTDRSLACYVGGTVWLYNPRRNFIYRGVVLAAAAASSQRQHRVYIQSRPLPVVWTSEACVDRLKEYEAEIARLARCIDIQNVVARNAAHALIMGCEQRGEMAVLSSRTSVNRLQGKRITIRDLTGN